MSQSEEKTNWNIVQYRSVVNVIYWPLPLTARTQVRRPRALWSKKYLLAGRRLWPAVNQWTRKAEDFYKKKRTIHARKTQLECHIYSAFFEAGKTRHTIFEMFCWNRYKIYVRHTKIPVLNRILHIPLFLIELINQRQVPPLCGLFSKYSCIS